MRQSSYSNPRTVVQLVRARGTRHSLEIVPVVSGRTGSADSLMFHSCSVFTSLRASEQTTLTLTRATLSPPHLIQTISTNKTAGTDEVFIYEFDSGNVSLSVNGSVQLISGLADQADLLVDSAVSASGIAGKTCLTS